MSCIVAQQSSGSGAKMLRLLREQHESQDPAGSVFLPRRLEPCPRKAKHFGAAVCLSNEKCRTILKNRSAFFYLTQVLSQTPFYLIEIFR
ncbi:hypothetical protein SAMN04488054_14616 [Salibacterium qingdaonense]|uniref:Uncharacterized protein n=2 Tax=Salibacterium qingdaonense TaxID=266892 RepID=A0A1I4QQC2_9BACI|nr:hypothetical protein SAMN04488054_14616 [Salibacterium qingdaonense]